MLGLLHDGINRNRRTRLKSEISRLAPWFHNLHMPDGTQTAPDHALGDFPSYKWREIAAFLPEDLTGWSVLDIGCNAGFYSFQLASRGANVEGIDSNLHYLSQAKWASKHFDVKNRVHFEKKTGVRIGPKQKDL